MNDVVIRAEGLGKKYLIGHEIQREKYTALRDVIGRTAKGIVRSASDMLHGRQIISGDEVEEFWALKDINFEIKRGEVVGIIGRNGAGKSTLLKVLSRITEPSEGRVEIKGRVASLLEVGTGFHPELTGRENIFLNGAILGMSRYEIRSKFDEIVNFAEVEKFLDTPVKRYSSGMYVRLAFAVAAHLEPEILVVDEVLAVGDAEFQKKCLGKMQDVAGTGRTVLFVSHNMSSISTICKLGLLINEGKIQDSGDIHTVIANYTNKKNSATEYLSVSLKENQPCVVSASSERVNKEILRIHLTIKSPDKNSIILNLRIKNSESLPVGMASIGGFDEDDMINLLPGENSFALDFPISGLAHGAYLVSIDLERPYNIFIERLEDILGIQIDGGAATPFGRALMQNWNVGSVRFEISCEKIK